MLSEFPNVLDSTGADALRAFMLELVAVAASPSLRYFRRQFEIENKALQGFDPVTVADRETEAALRKVIAARYPAHGIVGEEGTALNPDARFQWIIDPIDGTRAYVCGVPTWSTLIGLCDRDVPLLGLMSQPFVGEYFLGGPGGSINVGRRGRRHLRTSATTDLAQASLFATSPDMFDAATQWPRFDALSRGARLTRFGVDSYAYCLLAAGLVDVVAEAGLGFHDIAALIPIIEAAGGVVSDWHGKPVRGAGAVLGAANSSLHEAALRVLSG